MAKENIENKALNDALESIPAGNYFLSLIKGFVNDFDKSTIKIKNVDFDPDTKSLELEFVVKNDSAKIGFKISSQKTKTGMLYAMEFETDDTKHVVSYESIKL